MPERDRLEKLQVLLVQAAMKTGAGFDVSEISSEDDTGFDPEDYAEDFAQRAIQHLENIAGLGYGAADGKLPHSIDWLQEFLEDARLCVNDGEPVSGDTLKMAKRLFRMLKTDMAANGDTMQVNKPPIQTRYRVGTKDHDFRVCLAMDWESIPNEYRSSRSKKFRAFWGLCEKGDNWMPSCISDWWGTHTSNDKAALRTQFQNELAKRRLDQAKATGKKSPSQEYSSEKSNSE